MSPFGLENLPYGAFSIGTESPRIGVAFGDSVLDLAALERAGLVAEGGVFEAPVINPFLARGPDAWARVRHRLTELLSGGGGESALVPLSEATLHLPFEVADYVDFYSSLEHATNLGRLFRPGGDPLLPNWRHLPVGYHGRAGTVVVGGTPVVRPSGQSKPADADEPRFGPSRRLDIELELGFVVGVPSRLGEPVPADRVAEHVFGVVLVNDWSARDIQAWEYQPLGPFLGKSFATSISPWVVPLAALEPFRIPGPAQEPAVLPYLQRSEPAALDLALEVGIRSRAMAERGDPPDVVSRTNARDLYWTIDQQVAHATVNGASLRTGDLLASGTISGSEPDSRGSLIELTWNGSEPLTLSDGSTRTFLQDGDEVVLRGLAGTVSLGEVWGRIEPAVRP